MNKKVFTYLCLIAYMLLGHLHGQVVDRYPFIQCPTEQSAVIAWRTAMPGIGTLHFGTDSTTLAQTLTDSIPTQKHAFDLTQLAPNTQYYYQVETDMGYQSQIEHFFTAKPPQISTVSFLHYGDCGYNNTVQQDIASLMEQEVVDFAVVAGDVDQGDGSNYDDIFFGVYKNMLARDCHYTAIGNHDLIFDQGNTYLDAFYLPTNNLQNTERYYTFTWGNTKFICLDSNIDYSPGSDQHNFLLEEMQCNDRQWLFVFFHHPPWTNAWDPSYYVPFQPYYEYDGNDDMRTDLVPYFEQYGVDFVLNGHSHCYQRGEMNGVQYVISGGAGSSTLDQPTCNTWPSYNACAPNISVELYENHYVRFDISGDTARYFAMNIQGNNIDSVTVVKAWQPYAVLPTIFQPTPGNNDGQISLAISGPRPPYSIVWNTGDTTFMVSGLGNGTYIATITNGFGCERQDTFQLGPLTAVESPVADGNFVAFPNPFSGQLSAAWNSPVEFLFELRDATGRLVAKRNGHGQKLVLDTQTLTPGVYLYTWRANGQLLSGKVMRIPGN